MIMLMLLLVLHFVVNLAWILANNAPLPWDSANHTFISFSIAEKIKNLDFLGIFKASNYYPILVHLLSAIPVLFIGAEIKFVQALGTIYFLLTLIIIYLYAKFLTKSDSGAFLVTMLFSFAPVVFNWSRFIMLDIPNVGFLVLSLYFFEKSQNFLNRKNTLLFFISAAFLAMTKWTGLLYLSVPAVLVLFNFYKSKNKLQIFKMFLTGSLLFLIVVLPWYLVNLGDLIYFGKLYSVDHSNPEGSIRLDFNNFTEYFRIYFRDQVGPISALGFLISVPFFLISKIGHKKFILSMIVFNYLLFSLLGNKDSRFTMHLLVFTSLVTIIGFKKINSYFRKLGNLLVFSILTFSFLYFLALTLRPLSLEGYKLSSPELPFFGRLNFINISDSLVKGYDLNDWKLNQLLQELEDLTSKKEVKVLVVSEWRHLNPSNIRTYSYAYNLKNIQVTTADIVFLKSNYNLSYFPTREQLAKFISENSFVLIAEENLGSPVLLNGKALKQIQEFIWQENLPNCTHYQINSSPFETYCKVNPGEELISESDVQINKGPVLKGEKVIKGFSVVFCKWGCTFGLIKTSNGSGIKFTLLKVYTLPNLEKINLFKID